MTYLFGLISFSGNDHRRTRVANAYFSLFMALGNVLGFATGAFSGWFKVFPFTLTSACNTDCANLKSAFIIDVAFIAITTFISVKSAKEIPLNSIGRSEDLHRESTHEEEAFLWELFGTFSNFPPTVWVILCVTALTWIGWFPFLLFDTDWMGREIYGGQPNDGEKYNIGVRTGALGLMLNSVVLGITSVLLEKLCRKLGTGIVWGISNIIMALSFLSMLVLSFLVGKMNFANSSPPNGVVIAALVIFTILGFPLAVSFSCSISFLDAFLCLF